MSDFGCNNFKPHPINAGICITCGNYKNIHSFPKRIETAWCVSCGGRFTDTEIEGKFGCPACGSQGIPCATKNDVRVEINWHELRILTIWAENHAERMKGENATMPRTVMAIARRLQGQHPKLTPLTLAAEITELPQKVEGIGPIETHGIGKPQPIPVNGPGAVGHI
jgi:predicted RNA-binding Zn-ribbon protein involved in translation (DUF1610 family)